MNKNIELRPFSLQYRAELFHLTDKNRSFLRQWLPWLDNVQTEADSANFIANSMISDQDGKTLNYFIFSEENLIGTIVLREITPQSASVGYWLAEDYQGQGIMSWAVAEIIAKACSQKLTTTLFLGCNPENKASARVAEKCGFTFSHRKEKAENLYGQWHDLDIYCKHIMPS